MNNNDKWKDDIHLRGERVPKEIHQMFIDELNKEIDIEVVKKLIKDRKNI